MIRITKESVFIDGGNDLRETTTVDVDPDLLAALIGALRAFAAREDRLRETYAAKQPATPGNWTVKKKAGEDATATGGRKATGAKSEAEIPSGAERGDMSTADKWREAFNVHGWCDGAREVVLAQAATEVARRRISDASCRTEEI
jgi:hypothetical protein